MNRRDFLVTSAATAAVVPGVLHAQPAGSAGAAAAPLKGRLKQSVCQWCFGGVPLEDLCRGAKEIGLQSVELLGEKDWPVVQGHGLVCAVAGQIRSNPIHRGWNRVEHHDEMVKELEQVLPKVKAAGIPQQIVFSGNRGGMSDAEGLKNCAIGLKRVTPLAEKLGVTLIMELLNSRVDHKDYMCDRTAWGVELCKEVGSPRFKLLYDIYHMQIMEGDVIRTIRDNFEFIGHYHTAGNPGRREFDDTQELNYRGICKALVDKGYTGYLGQEFMPSRDAMASLREMAMICDV